MASENETEQISEQSEGDSEAPEAIPERELALTAELATARKRVDELARAYQALDRDKEEFKKRLARERSQMIDVEKGKIALPLIEAIDELDGALSATAEPSALAEGVRLIREKMLKGLQDQGVERLSLLGTPFDPNLAEASDMEITTDPEEDGGVLQELRAGYRLGDRVIRPARVKIAKYVEPAQA